MLGDYDHWSEGVFSVSRLLWHRVYVCIYIPEVPQYSQLMVELSMHRVWKSKRQNARQTVYQPQLYSLIVLIFLRDYNMNFFVHICKTYASNGNDNQESNLNTHLFKNFVHNFHIVCAIFFTLFFEPFRMFYPYMAIIIAGKGMQMSSRLLIKTWQVY